MTDKTGTQLDTDTLFQQQRNSTTRLARPAPVIIADGLRTPENIGSVLRLADAMGSRRLILITEEPIDTGSRKLSRIARGAERCITVENHSSSEFKQIAVSLPPMIAIELTSRAENLFNSVLPMECSLVIGSERHGISADILALCQGAVFIPMYGVNGSMNVSQALAMGLYEWRRQYPD